jgi:hypothetical protein
MNTEKVQFALLVLLLLLLVVVIIYSCIKPDYKNEFLKDMHKLNEPIFNLIKKSGYDSKIINIYNSNKIQIDNIYSNKKSKETFEQLIQDDCLHDELILKMLNKLDDDIMKILTNHRKSKGPDYIKGIIIAFLTMVYILQGLKQYRQSHSSGSESENEYDGKHTPMHNMCTILACDSKGQHEPLIATIDNPPTAVTKHWLTRGPNPIYTTGGYLPMNTSTTQSRMTKNIENFIERFNKSLQINYKAFAYYNTKYITPIMNKMKSELSDSICNRKTTNSYNNQALSLLDIISTSLANTLYNDLF